jgi:predicted transcriptional regulator
MEYDFKTRNFAKSQIIRRKPERMKEFMDKRDILDLKQGGASNRAVAKKLGIDRKTVAHYWNEYGAVDKVLIIFCKIPLKMV